MHGRRELDHRSALNWTVPHGHVVISWNKEADRGNGAVYSAAMFNCYEDSRIMRDKCR